MIPLLRLLWLVLLWVVLWGSLSVANVASGAVVAVGVMAVAGRRPRGQVVIRPWWVAVFAGYFLVKLVEASVIVARQVVARNSRIRTAIVAVPLRGSSATLVTIIADAISLTPGTLTVEVHDDPRTLYVHVLQLRDVERVRADVRRLELLAVRAFGTRAALVGAAHDDTRLVADR